jgi:hypothetical protein
MTVPSSLVVIVPGVECRNGKKAKGENVDPKRE